MKPEYFPPKEDVILQNEAPTDFYILCHWCCGNNSVLFVSQNLKILNLSFFFC